MSLLTKAAAQNGSTQSGPRGDGVLFRLTLIATMGGLLFGYDTGVISGALLFLANDLGLNATTQAAVVSVLVFGAMFGAIFVGRISDRIGRRGALLICAVMYVVGALACALAPNVEFMILARFVLGLGVGAAAATCPLYLAELAPAHRRGRIVTINEFMIVFGQMLAFVINMVIASFGHQDTWRWMLGVAVIPAIIFLIGLGALPDSPRWYALVGRIEDARRVLHMVRTPEDAESELAVIRKHVNQVQQRDKGSFFRDLKEMPWMRRTIWIGIGLAVAQQLTGIGAAIYYAPTILKSTGLGDNASLVATVAVGVIGVIATAVGIWMLGFINRRKLLVIGFAGVAVSQTLLALCFLLPGSDARSYLILGAMVLDVAFVQCFIGIGVWLLLSEIFPQKIRGAAMGIAVFALWAANTVVSFVFPVLVAGVGPTETFGIFVALNVVALVFVARFTPETKDLTLEEFEEKFRIKATSGRRSTGVEL